MRQTLILLMLAIGCVMLGVPVRAAERAALIEYRQHLMRTLEAQFQAMMLIVTAGAPPQNLHSHLSASLLTARMMPDAFAPRAPGGNSLPQVWTKWDDFAKHMREFEASVAIATEAARNGTKPADVLYHIDAISCRDCHDLYRRD